VIEDYAMSTSQTYHGPEILAAIERALKHLHVEKDTPVTVEVLDDALVITPINEVQPGEELDRIKEKLHAKFGETFRALSK
jgi:antitoxin component of MazEF toxin-antitoxin module